MPLWENTLRSEFILWEQRMTAIKCQDDPSNICEIITLKAQKYLNGGTRDQLNH